MKRACMKCSLCVVMSNKLMSCFLVCAGEFHRRRDPADDGQEAEYPQHVRHRSRRPRQVHFDGLPGLKGRYHRWRPRRRDAVHGHAQGRAGQMHHHQVNVSTSPPHGRTGNLLLSYLKATEPAIMHP